MPYRVKTSDEARNTTVTLADDSMLSVSLAASTTYWIEVAVGFNTGATPDIKATISYSSTITEALGVLYGTIPSTDSRAVSSAQTLRTLPINGAFFTTPTALGGAGSATAAATGGWYVRALFKSNGAGTLKVQWAQTVSDASNTTVLKGSYIRYTPVADLAGTMIVKSANESRASTTTVAPDSELWFAAEADGQYIIEWMFNQQSSNTPRFKYAFTDANATAAGFNTWRSAGNAFNTNPSAALAGIASSFREPLLTAGTATTFNAQGQQKVDGAIIHNSTPSNVEIQWSQNISSGTASVMNANSWFWYEKIPLT